uniref:Chlorophyll a-b binding protein, chloroplastic n=1 Tax=Cucumis melo TaxID=3656 RepID=A0A9I9CZF0_CUCME
YRKSKENKERTKKQIKRITRRITVATAKGEQRSMAVSISAATPFHLHPSSSSHTPLFNPTNQFVRLRSPSRPSLLIAHAQSEHRQTWLPGLDPPPYLDGTLVGDFGFDPLGLGEDPDSLKWYVQAELVHCRFAMLGVAGVLLTDLLRVTGISELPVWYNAGAVEYGFANKRTLFIVQLLLMGFVETKRYMDFKSPGSQAQEGTFFGLEAAFEGLEPGYPGGPLLNPLGIAKDVKNAHDWKLKEIKNG